MRHGSNEAWVNTLSDHFFKSSARTFSAIVSMCFLLSLPLPHARIYSHPCVSTHVGSNQQGMDPQHPPHPPFVYSVTGKGSPLDNPSEYLNSFYMYDYIGGRFSVTRCACVRERSRVCVYGCTCMSEFFAFVFIRAIFH